MRNWIINSSAYTGLLFIIRVAVGWHFLYEGLSKLFDPSWTAYYYLNSSNWIFSGFFHWMTESPEIMKTIDLLNIWGLIIIGIALFFGVFTKIAATSGIVLLLMYYLANPPFIGMNYDIPTEGHYLIVNKNMIEMLVLCLFLFSPTEKIIGIDKLWKHIKNTLKKEKESVNPYKKVSADGFGRREIIKNLAALPLFGGFVIANLKEKGWLSYEENFLKTDAITSVTKKSINFQAIDQLKEKIPSSRAIGGINVSRVIMGGNLMGGWAHARELIYVSELVKSYHTDKKVFETLRLAEECGINTLITNQTLSRVINAYWDRGIGKIQFISDCGSADLIEGAKISIDNGASACYIHGGYADSYVHTGRIDKIQEALEFIKQNEIPGGIGAHKLSTVKACVEYGLDPDFWMKTLHVKDYLNVKHELEPGKITENEEVMYKNVFCDATEETVKYMETLKKPWIAFKILAAGSIEPEVGFKHAFECGADFICVGMYDFQVVRNANIATDVLNSNFKNQRKREWLV